MDIPSLETERLILRAIDPERDFEAWYTTFSDPETVRLLYNNQVQTREMAWMNMVAMIGHWAARGYGFFSVIEKESGAWVGRVGPYYPYGWPEPEIGWAVQPGHRRKGFAKEAALASLDYVFNDLDWSQTAHVIVEGNEGSIRTAEAIGSTLRERIDGPRPRLIYRQDRAERTLMR